MATLTIRNLDDEVKQALRERAARHGVSMEEEARVLLRQLVQAPPPAQGRSAYQRIRDLVEPLGGVELEIPPRTEKAGERKVFDWLDDKE
ncbi:MAG: plasmid stabilization protein [Hoeflea sp.]|uniref:FitA-like ribbon-helix-helix domain-containing protein n=1 Tax=Hoeflea sp. TaxID=1940281 RepID=UPI000C0E3281|nr:plasmid stabilization protein [Hoeflea sp.]PHR23465.1 MAG: plasmid stabilization protein [Hoeflea sp.]